MTVTVAELVAAVGLSGACSGLVAYVVGLVHGFDEGTTYQAGQAYQQARQQIQGMLDEAESQIRRLR